MKTKIEIIEEVFDNHFVLDPSKRSKDKNGKCLYLSPNGNKCAVGMCMDFDKHKDEILSVNENSYDDTMNDILKPDYQGHNQYFWGLLQDFHDWSLYWTKNGLSLKGKERLELLKDRFKDQ